MTVHSARHRAAQHLARLPRPSRVRPFAVTGGRTRANRTLGVETLVSAVDFEVRLAVRMSPEAFAVYEACQARRSVAEVQRATGLALGVVRVLVGDLAEKGRLRVHAGTQEAPTAETLRRVRDGLARL